MNPMIEGSIDELTEVDGYLVDANGEIQGTVEKPEFHVTDRNSAEWVLEKMAQNEAEILAIEARTAALFHNLESQKKKFQQRVDFFRFRYGNELESFARQALEGQKSKTYQLDNGSISFRTSKGTNKITDMEVAVGWAESYAADIVRVVKSVTVTDLLQAWEVERNAREGVLNVADASEEPTAIPIPESPPFVESSGPQERVTISTGVGE